MGNKSAGWKDLCFVCRKHVWVFLLLLICFCLLIPFSTAGLNGSSIFNILVTHEQMKFRLFHDSVIFPLMAVLVVSGLLLGISLFRFLLDKKETTIFLSLGIKRNRLFVNRLIAGCLILLFSIGIPMILSYILNLCALGTYQGLLRNTVYLIVCMFLCAVFSMLLAACAVFMAGTMAEATVFWAGLICIPLAIFFCVNVLLKELFWGNAWGVTAYTGMQHIRASFVDQFARLNPLLFLKAPMEANGKFIRPLSTAVPDPVDVPLVIGWLFAAVLAGIIAWLLLRGRKAEAAGTHGHNPVLPEIVIFLSGFAAFAIVYSLLCRFGAGLAVCLAALAFFAVHLFWRKVLFSEQRSKKRNGLSFVIQGAVIAAVCIICAVVLPGQTLKTLEKTSMESAEISYVGDPSLLYTQASGSSTGRGYYLLSPIKVRSEEAIDLVKEIHKEIAVSGKAEKESGEKSFETVIPYDLCFRYQDTKGNEHVWYYDRVSYRQLEKMIRMEDTSEVKQAQISCLTSKEVFTSRAQKVYRNGEVYLTDPLLCNTFRLSFDEEQRQNLLQMIAEDVSALSSGERYFPETKAKAVLMFTGTGEQDCKYFTYHLDNAYVYLTEDYQKTLQWLSDNELLQLVDDAPQAEYLYLQKFDPYIGINGMNQPLSMYFMAYCADTEDEFIIQKDFGNQYKISDADEIKQILNGVKDGCFMTEGGYLVSVKLVGEERFRYLFLPENEIPDFIKR